MDPTELHLTDEQVRAHGAGTLAGDELLAVSDHAATCVDCRARLQNGATGAAREVMCDLRSKSEPPFHLSYELMREHVKDGLDATDREVVESHLADCGACRRELDDLKAFALSLDGEAAAFQKEKLEGEHEREKHRGLRQRTMREQVAEWWGNWTTRGLLVMGGGVVALMAMLLAAQVALMSFARHMSSEGPAPRPETVALSLPTSPREPVPPSPPRQADGQSLKDGGQTIALVDGRLTGMPSAWPVALKEDIQKLMNGASLHDAAPMDLLAMNDHGQQGLFRSQSVFPDKGSIASPPTNGVSVPAPQSGYTLDQIQAINPISHLARGLALWKTRQVAAAKKEFEALAVENPDSPVARRLLKEVDAVMESAPVGAGAPK